MTIKPLIGINVDHKGAAKGAPAYSFLASRYHDCIVAAGGIPVIIPPMESEEDLHRVLDRVEGFLMIGGADLDPRRDGFHLHPSVRMMDPRRETFDRMLVRAISERRIPLLAVGVGMQLLNVSQGGNLFLHLPEDCPEAVPHKDQHDSAHRHALVVERGSAMERVYGDGEIRVNSMHHMAVDEVARGFRVTARCPDGVIEAIESVRPDWFAVGVQFHPESESASALDIRIFEQLISAITGVSADPVAEEEEVELEVRAA